MKKFIFILYIIPLMLLMGCNDFDEQMVITDDSAQIGNVERLDNGQIRVEVSLKSAEPLSASVASRASNYEDVIYSGWCLVFGEADNTVGYTNASPLLQKKQLVANANGTFFITFDPYEETAFLRLVVNLTAREEKMLDAALSWSEVKGLENGYLSRPTNAEVNTNNIATFSDYIYQSVGLDGIYDMGIDWYSATVTMNEDGSYPTEKDPFNSSITNLVYTDENKISPNPNNISTSFPMSSIGFVMDKIDEVEIKELFESEVYMIRTCSKFDIYNGDSGFVISEIYLLDAANEARLRSTVLESSGSSGTETTTDFGVPNDLGGTVDYEPLVGAVGYGQTSSPIYFYPNSGGDYNSSDGPVNQDINPQYIIFKGRATGYDTDGYYKVALKAQYPLTYNYDSDGNIIDVATWSNLTYNILRNTHFTVNINGVDKPGYKTLADAKDKNSPASNISYSIIIDCEDGRNEILVSKGTHFVELESSRIYVKGYGTEGVTGSVKFSVNPSAGNSTPAIYVQAGDYDANTSHADSVKINYCTVSIGGGTATRYESVSSNGDAIADEWVHIPSQAAFEKDAEGNDVAVANDVEVTVNFTAIGNGRLRLRIGDILKFIPICYEVEPVKIAGENPLTVSNWSGESWSRFDYSDIFYTDGSTLTLSDDGSIAENTTYSARNFGARLFPKDGSGFMHLYLKQASDFVMWDKTNNIESENIEVVYNSIGEVVEDRSHKMVYNSKGVLVDSGEDPTLPSDGKYSYEIMGDKSDVTLIVTDYIGVETLPFAVFNQVETIAVGEPFSFQITNIGTNNGESTLESNASFLLANSAGESKKYNIKITQYPAPVADGGGGENPDLETGDIGDIEYIIPKPFDDPDSDVLLNYYNRYADNTFWQIWGTAADAGKQLQSIYVHNCYYTKSEISTEEGLGWQWEAVPDEIANKGTGTAATQLERIDAALRVDTAVEPTGGYGTYRFDIIMNDRGTTTEYAQASAFFVLRVENEIGEVCKTRLLIQCRSSSS